MAERFFCPDPLEVGDYVLTGPEAHHLAHVRRIELGERVVLFNGDGREYPAEVISVGRRCVVLSILSVEEAERELPVPIWVASALPKADRTDFLVEKLTELGVTRFIPLLTARSVVIPREGAVERFERAVIEASKQCGRNRLMHIDPPQRWEQFVGRTDLPPCKVLLHPNTSLPPLSGVSAAGGVLAVGPEGGFTAEEITAARENGWELMNLGPRTLRIETAALTAVARWSDPLRLSPSPPSAAAAESQAASDGTPLETGLDRAGLRSP
ncbi:MAG: RsmE family RNA methyltransferase [Thermogemmata sp.]|jgi:16S rRNA (uracil1498-N3)-methyltransferase|uniref:Ribosomal RNA small subunit methyltransferase E n=1 Tax=Thermogemmata fonticola TaxID=2755323 RepID=A0A7V8VCE5_9BACT|nr:RsmE family RNA methyltransferase [Thermogemmata fonticola]MBA2225361.1 16S rRNA (uracil(1498)-N(3))-methyltransferase [Thermogemmata fonticola]